MLVVTTQSKPFTIFGEYVFILYTQRFTRQPVSVETLIVNACTIRQTVSIMIYFDKGFIRILAVVVELLYCFEFGTVTPLSVSRTTT